MNMWISRFRIDPINPLLSAGDEAIRYFVQRDLLDRDPGPLTIIADLPEVRSIVRKQQQDGSGRSPCMIRNAPYPYTCLIGTWKSLRFLVGKYDLDRDHPPVQTAAEFVFSCQSDEGDFRGILANQYAPYYTGAILSLLIKAGYHDDKRVLDGIRWLLSMRQDDGGWVIGSPGLVHQSWKETCRLTGTWSPDPARDFDRSVPFSAAGTGMAIRALAEHPGYRTSPETLHAATLLASKFFQRDNGRSSRHPDNWIRFDFPFWWNNLVSALESLSRIGLPEDDCGIRAALAWLAEHQQDDGLWNTSYSSIHRSRRDNPSGGKRLWVSLAICRIFRRYYG